MPISRLYKLITIAAAVLTVWAGLVSPVFAATYVSQAVVVSADLLSGSSAASITNFHYNIASLPGDSSVRIQFSKDNANWYSATGSAGAWTPISALGGADLSLAAFVAATSWASGQAFYYKLELNATTDLTQTPALEDIRLDYTPASGFERTFVFDNNGRVGIGTASPWYNLDIAVATTGGRGINIANTASAGTNYGVYSAATGASTANYGGYFQSTGATNNYGLGVAAMTGANSIGLDIGLLSGATANTGIKIGNISGGASTNYGINLGSLTGGTGSSGYQINAGNIVALASGNWGGINLGTILPAASATTYGINIGNTLAGAGAATYGINIGANLSTATSNFGLKIGAISGAGTTNTGLYVDTVSGATNNYAAIFAGGNVGIGTAAPLLKLDVAGSGRFTGAASSTLTGTADPTASTTLVGTGTLFLTQLVVGDRITVNAETRTVTAIASNTSLTADTAFSDTPAASVTKLPAIFLASDSASAVKLVLDSAGSVGIGIATPLSKLTVLDTAATSPRGILSMQISNDANGARAGFSKARGTVAAPLTVAAGDMIGQNLFRGYDGTNYLEMASINVGVSGTVGTGRVPTYMAFSTGTDAVTSVLTEAMRITNSNNVGIGTPAPVHKLDVLQTGTTTGLAAIKGLNSGINVGTAYGVYGTATGASQTNVGGYFSATGGVVNNYGLIVESGNVGIGTTAPSYKLDVNGEINASSLRSSGNWVITGRGGMYNGISTDGVRLWANGILSLSGGTGASTSDQVVINQGNVGIGTTSPLSKLHSKESGAKTAVNYAGYFENIATNTTTDAIDKYGAYITSTGGFTGLGGTATNNYGLYIDAVSGGDNNYGLVVKTVPTTANGANVYYDSATGILYQQTSSERYKTDIQPLQFDYRQVLNIPIKQWNMKTDGSLGIGMVAEEVAALNMPELVIYNSAGQPDGIQWDRVTSYMLGVVKDQQMEIDALNLAVGVTGTIGNASSTSELASGNGIGDWLANGLESLGLGLQNGIASLKEIVAGKVTTKEMCVTGTDGETICVSKDELKQMLQNSGTTSGSSNEPTSPTGSNTSNSGSSASGSNATGGSDTGSSGSSGGSSGFSGEGTATSTPPE